MKRRTASLALLLSATVALPGCARYYYGDAAHISADLIDANTQAIESLLQNQQLDPLRPILVSTLVHIDRLGESSRLGRTLSEQLAGRLVQRGVLVVEPRLRDNLVVSPSQGELLLSRELSEISQRHDAQAVLIGTYSPSLRTVYVSIKLVHPVGNMVMAAADYSLPMNDDLRSLLHAR